MWNWVRKNISSFKNGAVTPSEVKNPKSKLTVTSQKENFSSNDIGTTYYGLVLGVNSPSESKFNTTETSAIDELNKILESDESRADMIPRLPDVVPEIMQSMRDDDVSNSLLAKQVSKDVTLVGEVICMANSPYFRLTEKIESLEQAIMTLGHSGLRYILLKAAFKPIMNIRQGHFTRLGSNYVWRQSEYCAFVAQCIAKKRGADPFESFLAGLLREIGVIIALKAMDNISAIGDAPRSYKFHKIFAQQSLKLSSVVAKEWQFPVKVVEAISEQAMGADLSEMSLLGSVLYPATLMARLQLLVEEGRMDSDTVLNNYHIEGHLTDDCKFCFEELQKYSANK